MLQGVLRSPLSFFDTTLTGRIVNRFMVDQALLDETVPAALQLFIQKLFQFIGTVVAVAYISPIMLAFLVVLAIPYFYLARRYALPARDLRRIESVQRSPVLSLFSECMKGCFTVRACIMLHGCIELSHLVQVQAFSAYGRFLGGIHKGLTQNLIAQWVSPAARVLQD